jgi:hypothetical protein
VTDYTCSEFPDLDAHKELFSGRRITCPVCAVYQALAAKWLVYTSAMKRLFLATLALSPILPAAAIAQVKIAVPAQQHKVLERIDAKVENVGKQPITFCVEMGQTSSNGSEIESTPSPFWVQRSRNGKSGTLLIGLDAGSFRGTVVLEAGEKKEFPFRLSSSGRMRLRLNYWRGASPDLDCHAPPKHSNVVASDVFTIG